MAKKTTEIAWTKQVIAFVKDANDISVMMTGKSAPDLLGRLSRLLGIAETVERELKSPQSNSGPYAVLGVREDAGDIVVKAAYRTLQRRYHPDTGLEPSDEKSKELNKAMAEIHILRGRKF